MKRAVPVQIGDASEGSYEYVVTFARDDGCDAQEAGPTSLIGKQ